MDAIAPYMSIRIIQQYNIYEYTVEHRLSGIGRDQRGFRQTEVPLNRVSTIYIALFNNQYYKEYIH